MSYETECTECHRTVGVIKRFQGSDRPNEGPLYKVALHASIPPSGVKGERRPRCLGTGLPVPPMALHETTTTPGQRKKAAARAGRATLQVSG